MHKLYLNEMKKKNAYYPREMGGATLHKIMFKINMRVLDNFILLDGINHYLYIFYITQKHTDLEDNVDVLYSKFSCSSNLGKIYTKQ